LKWEEALTFAFLGLGATFWCLAFKVIWESIARKKE